MHAISSTAKVRTFACLVLLACGLICISNPAQAGILPVGPEIDAWSDMAFPSGVSGGYDSGTLELTVAASPSNDMEIGGQFGPSKIGRHYGTGGTLGGPFSATLSVSGAEIQNDGTVTDGGSVTITYVNGVPATMAGLAKDYGVVPNDILLQGTVLEVLLEATGDDTLDVLFSVSGGALQNVNPALGTNFAPTNLALLRIAGVALPADFSQCFDLSGATIDVLSIPEPSSVMLCLLGAMFALAGTSKHYSFGVTRR